MASLAGPAAVLSAASCGLAQVTRRTSELRGAPLRSGAARSHCPSRGASKVQRRVAVVRATIGGPGALTPELKEALDKFVSSNKVVLFMKGTKLFPQCGFSNTCVQILNLMECPYETVNILEDEQLRQALKEYSAWPTFPQLYVDGEFFGGCDITIESFQKGELKEIIEKAMLS